MALDHGDNPYLVFFRLMGVLVFSFMLCHRGLVLYQIPPKRQILRFTRQDFLVGGKGRCSYEGSFLYIRILSLFYYSVFPLLTVMY